MFPADKNKNPSCPKPEGCDGDKKLLNAAWDAIQCLLAKIAYKFYTFDFDGDGNLIVGCDDGGFYIHMTTFDTNGCEKKDKKQYFINPEMLAKLKGEKGDTGATGAQGPAGQDGINGQDGEDGQIVEGEAVCFASEYPLKCSIEDAQAAFMDSQGKIRVPPYPRSNISDEDATDPPCVAHTVTGTGETLSEVQSFVIDNTNGCYDKVVNLEFFLWVSVLGNSPASGNVWSDYRVVGKQDWRTVNPDGSNGTGKGIIYSKSGDVPRGGAFAYYPEEIVIPCGQSCTIEIRTGGQNDIATSAEVNALTCIRLMSFENGDIL